MQKRSSLSTGVAGYGGVILFVKLALHQSYRIAKVVICKCDKKLDNAC